MKKIMYLICVLSVVLLLSSCSKTDKLSFSSTVKNNDCVLTKVLNDDSKKKTIVMSITENYIEINNDSVYSYYFYKDNVIYYTYDLSMEYSNAKGLNTILLDDSKYGIDSDFNKVKELIQLSFIYTNFTDEKVSLENLYNTVNSNDDITTSFKKNLSFYDNIMKYYNKKYCVYDSAISKYVNEEFSIEISDANFSFLKCKNSYISKSVLQNPISLDEFKIYKTNDYINLLATYSSNIEVRYTLEDDLTKINSSLTITDNIREVYAYSEDTTLLIKEYKTNEECSNVYNEYVNKYMPEGLYFAKKDNLLFMSNVENNKYSSLLNVEFTASIFKDSSNLLSDSVYDFSLTNKILNDDYGAILVDSYNEYLVLANQMKTALAENEFYTNLSNEIDSITEDSFNDSKYLIIQHNEVIDTIQYKQVIYGAYLLNGNLDIILTKERDLSEHVNSSPIGISVYKLDKDLVIENINVYVNYLPIYMYI